jgi:hypothetical protein
MNLALLSRRRLLSLIGLSPAAAAMAVVAQPVPPVRVLFTRVNGERHYDAASLPPLAVSDAMVMRRESTNPYNRRAIEVWDDAGRKLGYVARIDDAAVARMMDAGKRFQTRVARLDPWTRDIRLEVGRLPG